MYSTFLLHSTDGAFPDFQIKDENEKRFHCFHRNRLNSRYVDIACLFGNQHIDVLLFEWLKETKICEIVLIGGTLIFNFKNLNAFSTMLCIVIIDRSRIGHPVFYNPCQRIYIYLI